MFRLFSVAAFVAWSFLVSCCLPPLHLLHSSSSLFLCSFRSPIQSDRQSRRLGLRNNSNNGRRGCGRCDRGRVAFEVTCAPQAGWFHAKGSPAVVRRAQDTAESPQSGVLPRRLPRQEERRAHGEWRYSSTVPGSVHQSIDNTGIANTTLQYQSHGGSFGAFVLMTRMDCLVSFLFCLWFVVCGCGCGCGCGTWYVLVVVVPQCLKSTCDPTPLPWLKCCQCQMPNSSAIKLFVTTVVVAVVGVN